MLDVFFVTQAKVNKQADKRAKYPAVPVYVFHPEAVCSQPDRARQINRENCVCVCVDHPKELRF